MAMSLLRRAIWLCFAVAGLAFLFGGEIISAIAGTTDRIFAAMVGFALALPCVLLGILAILAKNRLEEREMGGPKSLGEALRK
jgi:hypothetical protein